MSKLMPFLQGSSSYPSEQKSIILIKRAIYLKFGIVFSGVVAGFEPVKGVSGIDSINKSLYDKSTGSKVQNITS